MSITPELRYYSESGHVESDKVLFSFTVDIEAYTGSKMPPNEWMAGAIRNAIDQLGTMDATVVTVGGEA